MNNFLYGKYKNASKLEYKKEEGKTQETRSKIEKMEWTREKEILTSKMFELCRRTNQYRIMLTFTFILNGDQINCAKVFELCYLSIWDVFINYCDHLRFLNGTNRKSFVWICCSFVWYGQCWPDWLNAGKLLLEMNQYIWRHTYTEIISAFLRHAENMLALELFPNATFAQYGCRTSQ